MRRAPVLAAALICGLSAAALSAILVPASPVILALSIFVLLVLIASFLAADLLDFWLGIFVLSLPFNITKLLLFSPDEVYRLREQYGLKGIENLVPLVYAFDLPLLVLLALWLVRSSRARQPIDLPRVMALAAAHLAWATLTLAVATSKLLGMTWILYQAKMLLICACVVNVADSRRRLRIVVGALLVGLAFQASATAYSYTFQVGEDVLGSAFGARYTARELRPGVYRGAGGQSIYEKGDLLRGTGTIGAGNEQAKYFVMVLPVALVAAFLAHGPLLRGTSSLLFAGGLGALYLTFSRGGVICTAAAIAITLWLLASRGLMGRRTFVRLAAAAAMGAAVLSPLVYSFFTSRPQYLATRFDHIVGGLLVGLEHPIVGVGINNFAVSISPHDYGGIFKVPVHNHYVRVWCETGFVGIALYLSFFASILISAYRCTRIPDAFLSGLGIAALAGLTGIVIYWTDDIFYGVLIRAHIWLLAGTVLAVERVARKEALERPLAGPAGPAG